jgi:hypothetical protein
MRRLGVGREAAPAGGGRTYPRALGRPRVVVRAPLRGLCLQWLDGTAKGGRNPAGVAFATCWPGSTTPAPKIAAVARSQALRAAAMRIATLAPPPAPVGAPPPLML